MGLQVATIVLFILCLCVQNVDEWSFDVFCINDAGDGHALKHIGYELLQRYNIISKFKVRLHHS